MSTNRIDRLSARLWIAMALPVLAEGLVAGPALSGEAQGPLGRLGREVETSRGICVVLGDADCAAALDLARRSRLLVYTQVPDAAAVEKARAAAEAAGLDATRFQVERGPLDRIGLADGLADLLLATGIGAFVPEAEALRVVRPGGTVLLGERRLVAPVPEGVDDWSHPYHGPDNNPVSRDSVIRFPYLTQFLADPRYASAPQNTVASAGRVFKAFGNVAWHEREEAYLNTLVAFNGYNGTILWQRKLPDGIMVHRNTFIATRAVLYVGDDVSCKRFDAATGEPRGEIRPPADVAGGTFWKWMALEGGVLYAMTGAQEQKDPEKRWRRTEHGWPWEEISEGYNSPENPWGFGRDFLALDPETGAVLWHHREEHDADGRTVCMKGGRLFAFRFGLYLLCLDAKTGSVLWRKTPQDAPDLFEALGSQLPRQGWQTNWRTTCYVKCTDKALYFAGPQVRKLLAVSAEDGRILWDSGYNNFQLLIRDDGLYAISGGVWGENVSRKFDLLTGAVLAELSTGRRACTRPTGTADSILFRAMGGSVRLDLSSQKPRWISPMRPPCQDGVTIANGRLYWWPYACDCQLTLYGVTSLGPAGDFDFTPDTIAPERLERLAEASAPLDLFPQVSSADWPTFRANNRATATTTAVVPERARVLWQTRPAALAGTRPTAPVAAGGLVFLSGSDGVVRALDASSGKQKWLARTGGEVRLPPTIWGAMAYVGSGDGWVYAYSAASGRPLWRFRAAPAERKIPVYGALLSTWPAASGVVVEDGTAYVAAGIANYDGTYVYALDAATGAVKWRNDTSGHLDPEARTGVGVQGHMLLDGGKLYLAGGNAVSPAAYDIRDGRCLNDPALLARCESTSPRGWELFLIGSRVICCGKPYYAHPDIPVYDHTVTKKMLHASTGTQDIVWLDGERLLCFRPLERAALERCVSNERVPQHIIQAWGRLQTDQEPLWKQACPGSCAVALARNAVLVAGSRTVKAWALADGRELWTHDLPAAAVPWGLAVDAAGRVILTLVDGQVICLGPAA